MNDSRNIPWIRISVEGVAVVASILLAFAIDTWWDERIDRKTEQEELLRLQAEFQINIDRNLASTGQAGAMAASSQLYEEISRAVEKRLDFVDLSNQTIKGILGTPTLEVETPVLDSLIRSGRLAVIQNPEFLAAISNWERMVRNTGEFEQRARRFADEQLMPALFSAAEIGHVLVNHIPGAPTSNLDPNGIVRVSIQSGLLELVAVRYQQTNMASRGREQIRAADERVLAAIVDSLIQ
jgi:hypothetical protein